MAKKTPNITDTAAGTLLAAVVCFVLFWVLMFSLKGSLELLRKVAEWIFR